MDDRAYRKAKVKHLSKVPSAQRWDARALTCPDRGRPRFQIWTKWQEVKHVWPEPFARSRALSIALLLPIFVRREPGVKRSCQCSSGIRSLQRAPSICFFKLKATTGRVFFIALLFLARVAQADPEFRVVTGQLMVFDSGKMTPIRYNTQTDVDFAEAGSVRVFCTVEPQGVAEVEVLARSQVKFYFLGADVVLGPSGSIRATVEDIKQPRIKLSWEGGTATASKVLQTPEELLPYFFVSLPPVFSQSPIGDDDLEKMYPKKPGNLGPSPTPESNEAVEVDFPLETIPSPSPASSPFPAKDKSKPKPSPAGSSEDKAWLANSVEANAGSLIHKHQFTPITRESPVPSPATRSPSPASPPEMPAPMLKTLQPTVKPHDVPVSRYAFISPLVSPPHFAQMLVEPLTWMAAHARQGMPEIHVRQSTLSIELIPASLPVTPDPVDKSGGETNSEAPGIALIGQKDRLLIAASPAVNGRLLPQNPSAQTQQRSSPNVRGPVLLNRTPSGTIPTAHATPCIISPAIPEKSTAGGHRVTKDQ
jgi:hypothetical protein